jgi:hypothetical protein
MRRIIDRRGGILLIAMLLIVASRSNLSAQATWTPGMLTWEGGLVVLSIPDNGCSFREDGTNGARGIDVTVKNGVVSARYEVQGNLEFFTDSDRSVSITPYHFNGVTCVPSSASPEKKVWTLPGRFIGKNMFMLLWDFMTGSGTPFAGVLGGRG